MVVVDLYNGIYEALANNETVLNYLGLDVDSSYVEKAKRIQKRFKPPRIVKNLPLISFYTAPGRREAKNLNVYTADFSFDVYTADDVNLAHLISQEIVRVFEDKYISFENITGFRAFFMTAFESDVDLDNTYCFTTVIRFSVEL